MVVSNLDKAAFKTFIHSVLLCGTSYLFNTSFASADLSVRTPKGEDEDEERVVFLLTRAFSSDAEVVKIIHVSDFCR